MKAHLAVLDERMTGLDQRMTGEFATFRAEMTGELARGRQETAGEVAILHQEMTGMKHELTAVVPGEIIDGTRKQVRQLAFTLATPLVGLSGLAFAIGQLAA